MGTFNEYLSIFVAIGVAVGMAGLLWLLSHFLGPKHMTREKLMPYECGNDTEGTYDVRFPVRFFLVAIVFLLFDVALAILYPWVVQFKHMGWHGLFVALPLLGVVGLGLFYLIRKGALQWQ
jgi:NADH-quinone oxidoreductase subunit A